MPIVPNWKPTSHERVEQKDQRKRLRAKAKTARVLAAKAVSDGHRLTAYERDGGKCRATGKWLPFRHPSLLKVAHSHHVVFLSAGGSDGPENRITISWPIHKLIHGHRLDVTGNPNGTVHFIQKNLETGKVEHEWSSSV